jgi:hypothetical protein
MTPRDADAVHAYVIDESWKAYNQEHKQQGSAKPAH